MKPNIKPLGDRVLVIAVEESEQVKGGIIIPILPKKNPRKQKLWHWAQVKLMTLEKK